jgi:hypothetical protein
MSEAMVGAVLVKFETDISSDAQQAIASAIARLRPVSAIRRPAFGATARQVVIWHAQAAVKRDLGDAFGRLFRADRAADSRQILAITEWLLYPDQASSLEQAISLFPGVAETEAVTLEDSDRYSIDTVAEEVRQQIVNLLSIE